MSNITCVTCDKEEYKYDYQLNVGDIVPICEKCGEILYGYEPIYQDRILELTRMREYVILYKRLQQQKVLKLK